MWSVGMTIGFTWLRLISVFVTDIQMYIGDHLMGNFLRIAYISIKTSTWSKNMEESAKATEWIQSGQNVSKSKRRKARKKQVDQIADPTGDDIESSQGNVQSAVGEKQSQDGSENVREAVTSKSGTSYQTSEGNLQNSPVEKQSAANAINIDEVLPSESGTFTGDSPSRIVIPSLRNPDSEDRSGDSPICPSLPNLDSEDRSGDSPSGSIQGRDTSTIEETDKRTEKSEANIEETDKRTEKSEANIEETDKRTEKSEANIAYNPEFLVFLVDFRYQEMDYFKGILEAFNKMHRPWFFVPYEFILQLNERLALQIQDNYPRIYEGLKESVLQYLKLNGVECPNVELKILGVPEPRSMQMFDDFVRSINLFEVYQVDDGDQERLPSFASRRMCIGILKCLVDKFKTGRCWAGKWTVANIRVKNGGSEFVIVGCEDTDLDSNNGYSDLVTFTTAILARFKNVDGQFPPYFDEFGVDCQRIPGDVSDQVKMDRFLQLISCPLAFNPHLVRSTLLCETYVAANSHTTGNPPLYLPLAGKNNCDKDWRFIGKEKGVFKKVYEHQKVTRSRTLRTKYFHDPWEISHWSVLKFSRVFITHVLRHTKGRDFAQKIKDIAVVDIMLSRKLGKHIAALFRYIVLECGVSDGIFSSPWRHYVASECLDKPQGSIGMEAASAIDKILSSDSDEDEMFADVYAQLEIPSSELHKSTVISDADLADFESILVTKGIKCQVNPDGLLEITCQVVRGSVPQHIRVYKQEGVARRGSSSSGSSNKAIVVEGPYCDHYDMVFELLCTWLKL